MNLPTARGLLLFLLASAFACGGCGGGASVSGIHVDAAAGSDATGDGTATSPYRTITRGLLAAGEADTVRVEPGLYGEGETFPILVPTGVTLRGFPSSGDPVVLSGAGPYTSPSLGPAPPVTIVPGDGSQIASLRIVSPGGVAVWCEESGAPARVIGNEVQGSDFGVVVAGQARSLVQSNLVQGHGVAGIEVVGSAGPLLRRNEVISNRIGVAIRDAAAPDLGTAADPGENRIAGNADCDLANETGNVIEARGNVWDLDPFLLSASTECTGGTEIANLLPGSGAVLHQPVPPNASPIFTGSSEIVGLTPGAGAILATTTPGVSWTATGHALVVAAVFGEPIAVAGGRITNAPAMVWAWHTGLGTGREGAVAFADGVSPRDGSLEDVGPASPLQRGRTYYWAVWAWEATGTAIAASSPLRYFTVTN